MQTKYFDTYIYIYICLNKRRDEFFESYIETNKLVIRLRLRKKKKKETSQYIKFRKSISLVNYSIRSIISTILAFNFIHTLNPYNLQWRKYLSDSFN